MSRTGDPSVGPGRRGRISTGLGRLFARLADWALEPHGRLLMMGAALILIGAVASLIAYLFREPRTGRFHVWWLFLGTGAVCLIVGVLWRMCRRR